jgi:hypothetical protein
MNINALKYPIGKPLIPQKINQEHINRWIDTIELFPALVSEEVNGLNTKELKLQYRPKGWTIHQVVCHCLDSHINSFVRFKLALTENRPTIKTYEEAQWAELPDTKEYDLESTLLCLKFVHKRWVFLLKNLNAEQWEKTFVHPDGNEVINLRENLAIYEWHCRHHLEHIRLAKRFKFNA